MVTMETPSSSIITFFFLSLFITFLFQRSHSKTILVDGVSEWKNPSVHIGDSLIFQHKFHYNLYIFRSKQAFETCNFTQATQLTKPNSTTFMWNPSRPGFFYYTFNNGTLKSCEENEKFAVRVFPKPPESMATSPEPSPSEAPAPTSGGIVSSSPASHWHSVSPQASSPSSAPHNASAPVTVPSMLPDTGGIPFINSNPAIPLPTGETDAATIRPLATSAHGRRKVLVGVQFPLCFVVWLLIS